MKPATALLLFLSANGAMAACPSGQEVFMSCEIRDKGTKVGVCFDAKTATYIYGPNSTAPELTITTPITDLDYTPWAGVGRSIAEGVVFTNQGHSYEIYAGFDRLVDDEEDSAGKHFGGVIVYKGDAVVAELTCAPDTVEFTWGEGIWAAKHAQGQVWDYETRSWN